MFIDNDSKSCDLIGDVDYTRSNIYNWYRRKWYVYTWIGKRAWPVI